MIKDKQGLKTGTYIFSKTGLMSGIYTFSRNKKNKSSDNKESLKKKTPSNIVKQINSKNIQEEKKYAKNRRKTINNNNEGSISNVEKDSQKETTHVKEAIVKNRPRNEGQQSFDDSVIIQKVRQAFGFNNNDMVIKGNEDNNLDGIDRKDLEGMLIEGMRAYMELQKELNRIKANLDKIAYDNGKAWAQQHMINYLSCIREMANQIISCQSTLKQMKLNDDPQLKNFCNYIPMDSEIAALWPKRKGGLAFDPKNNDFDNFSNTVHSNTDTNYDTTITHNYDQFINNPEQFINNPFMNKNPFINKNNPLTNGGIPVTFYSYDPTYNTNMTGQDQTNNNLLNNSKMMETNYPNNLLNYEDYGDQPIINSESKTVGNYQNLNLLQGKY